jgi:flagellar hook capping protein FlgD
LARIVPTVLVVCLLGGTAAAFAVTQGLKLDKSPIYGTDIGRLVSPSAGTEAKIVFRLRESDSVTVSVVNGDGEVVRTLLPRQRVPPRKFTLSWDGRDEDGRALPEGAYQPRIRLADERNTTTLPNKIELDTTPPLFEFGDVKPRVISPDGDGRAERVSVRYSSGERVHALLFVDGRRRILTRARDSGVIRWGAPLRPGRYRLQVAAQDRAGNISPRAALGTVRIRYIELARNVVRARAGFRFGVGVSTDARNYRYRFAGRRGVGGGGLLPLRAPEEAGRYTLYVQANRHADSALVLVRPRER